MRSLDLEAVRREAAAKHRGSTVFSPVETPTTDVKGVTLGRNSSPPVETAGLNRGAVIVVARTVERRCQGQDQVGPSPTAISVFRYPVGEGFPRHDLEPSTGLSLGSALLVTPYMDPNRNLSARLSRPQPHGRVSEVIGESGQDSPLDSNAPAGCTAGDCLHRKVSGDSMLGGGRCRAVALPCGRDPTPSTPQSAFSPEPLAGSLSPTS